VTFIHIFLRTVEDIFRVIFVQRIISEVNVTAVQVFIGGLAIFFSCESSQSLVIDVQSQRVSASQEHVDSQIELQLVDKERIFDVILDYIFVTVENVLDVASQEDSSTLR
jgi:hypothetical protein